MPDRTALINICARVGCFVVRSCLNCWQKQVQNSFRRYSLPLINLMQTINMGSARRSWQGGSLKFHFWALCIFLFTLIFPITVLGGRSPESCNQHNSSRSQPYADHHYSDRHDPSGLIHYSQFYPFSNNSGFDGDKDLGGRDCNT